MKNIQASTLISVIKKYVKPGSLVWIGEISSYKKLPEHRFIHESVNHSKNYIDTSTVAHTQGVERFWVDSKSWYKSSRGNRKLLQSHLDESSWRKLRTLENNTGMLFETFLADISPFFRLQIVNTSSRNIYLRAVCLSSTVTLSSVRCIENEDFLLLDVRALDLGYGNQVHMEKRNSAFCDNPSHMCYGLLNRYPISNTD